MRADLSSNSRSPRSESQTYGPRSIIRTFLVAQRCRSSNSAMELAGLPYIGTTTPSPRPDRRTDRKVSPQPGRGGVHARRVVLAAAGLGLRERLRRVRVPDCAAVTVEANRGLHLAQPLQRGLDQLRRAFECRRQLGQRRTRVLHQGGVGAPEKRSVSNNSWTSATLRPPPAPPPTTARRARARTATTSTAPLPTTAAVIRHPYSPDRASGRPCRQAALPRSSRCRCGPVESPRLPTVAIWSPAPHSLALVHEDLVDVPVDRRRPVVLPDPHPQPEALRGPGLNHRAALDGLDRGADGIGEVVAVVEHAPARPEAGGQLARDRTHRLPGRGGRHLLLQALDHLLRVDQRVRHVGRKFRQAERGGSAGAATGAAVAFSSGTRAAGAACFTVSSGPAADFSSMVSALLDAWPPGIGSSGAAWASCAAVPTRAPVATAAVAASLPGLRRGSARWRVDRPAIPSPSRSLTDMELEVSRAAALVCPKRRSSCFRRPLMKTNLQSGNDSASL